jgi:hypothetical protein
MLIAYSTTDVHSEPCFLLVMPRHLVASIELPLRVSAQWAGVTFIYLFYLFIYLFISLAANTAGFKKSN